MHDYYFLKKMIRSKATRLRLLLIVWILLFWTSLAFPKSVILTFDEKVKKSDIIAIAEVSQIRKNLFSKDSASINLQEIIKGVPKSSNVKIKYGNWLIAPKEDLTELKVGKKYIFYLIKENSHFRLTGNNQGYVSIEEGDLVRQDDKIVNLNNYIELIKSLLEESNQ